MAGQELNVLYQSDNNYAPQTGISILSLFENNKDIERINIFILDDNIDDDNKSKIFTLGEKYDRNIEFIDTTEILRKLHELNVNAFRNTYTTYFKLLAIDEISTSNGLLLQLDGDTIINSSLSGLFDLDFGSYYVCAAAIECIHNSYKQYLGIEPSDYYYNCGVLFINQNNWRAYHCKEKIIEHLRTNRCQYWAVDQDIINTLFRDRILRMDVTYNFNSGFYIYGIDESYYIYDLDPSFYYEKSEITDALKGPVINHCMGAMTGRPWEQDSIHPQNELYDRYLEMSPWKDVPKKSVKRSTLFNLQRWLYLRLPRKPYSRLHKIAVKKYIKAKNNELQQSGADES